MSDDHDAAPASTAEVAALLRVSYRQLDYWVRNGYIPQATPCPGSGVRRRWTREEVQGAAVFAALVHAGLSPADACAAVPTAEVHADEPEPWFLVHLGRVHAIGSLLP